MWRGIVPFSSYLNLTIWELSVWQSSLAPLGKNKDHNVSIHGIQTAQKNTEQLRWIPAQKGQVD